jgi:DNA replication factor GINS
MNLDELRSVQSKERQKDSLQHLRDSFYEDVGEYIAELKDQRDTAAEAADDPFSNPDVGRLTDEIETAEEVVEAVYERRMGKIVKRASLAAAGMPSDEDGLTTEEKELFADIVDRIESNKDYVLDVLSGEASVDSSASVSTDMDPTADADPSADVDPTADAETTVNGEPTADADTAPDADNGVNAADLMGDGSDAAADPTPATADDSASGGQPVDAESGVPDAIADAERERARSPDSQADDGSGAETPPGARTGGHSDDGADAPEPGDIAASDESDTDGTPPAESPDDGPESDRATVRITRDVGQILGIDEREYDLAEEDVVQLPEQNVEPLVQRDAAERLD